MGTLLINKVVYAYVGQGVDLIVTLLIDKVVYAYVGQGICSCAVSPTNRFVVCFYTISGFGKIRLQLEVPQDVSLLESVFASPRQDDNDWVGGHILL